MQQMKQLIKGYSHSIEDTHVQVGQVCLTAHSKTHLAMHYLGPMVTSRPQYHTQFSINCLHILQQNYHFPSLLQVHEEFKQNVENIGINNLIQKFAELKGTGKERPGN